MGVDVGTVRVGVAMSDPDGILATPAVTLTRDVDGGRDLDALRDLVDEHNVVEVVVGLPRTLSGSESHAARAARAYGQQLTGRLAGRAATVVFVDERLTTVIAHQALAEAGLRSKARRGIVDRTAAVHILQSRLDAIRAGRG